MPGKSLDYFIGSVDWLDALTRPLEQHIERRVGGERKGCHDLGLMYHCGEGMAKDLNRAAGLFKKACEAGVSHGCEDLATLQKSL